MICPSCRMYVTNAEATECPRCGRPFAFEEFSGAPGSQPYGAPTSSPFGQPPGQMAPPGWMGQPGAPFPPPQPARRTSTKKIVFITLGSVVGALVVCVLLLVTLGGLGQALLKQTAHSTPTPFAGTTPGQTVLFQDPLTSNTNNWLDNAKDCYFLNGAYHIQGNFVCFAPVGILSDAEISVQVQQVSGPTTRFYGLVFRRTAPQTYYSFAIDSNSKWLFGKSANGTFTQLIPFKENAAIKGGLNTTNTLMLRARGSHFEFFVNGTKVGEADDTTFAQGKAGLISNTGVEVAFNNFEITTP